jgi:hypothetical protein
MSTNVSVAGLAPVTITLRVHRTRSRAASVSRARRVRLPRSVHLRAASVSRAASGLAPRMSPATHPVPPRSVSRTAPVSRTASVSRAASVSRGMAWVASRDWSQRLIPGFTHNRARFVRKCGYRIRYKWPQRLRIMDGGRERGHCARDSGPLSGLPVCRVLRYGSDVYWLSRRSDAPEA